MKIKLNTKVLGWILQRLSYVIPSKTAIPAYENVLINADEAVTLATSNGESVLVATINQEEGAPKVVEEKGETLIPFSILFKMVTSIPEEFLTIETRNENVVVIDWEKGNAVLPSFDSKDFGKVKDIVNVIPDDAETISSESFIKAVKATVYAIAEEQTRPALNCIHIERKKDRLCMVGTDAHMLGICEIDMPETEKGFTVDVDGDHVRCITRILPSVSENITVYDNQENKRLEFFFANFHYIIPNRSVKFPAWERVVPKDNPFLLTVEEKFFSSAIRRMLVLSDKAKRMISINITSDMMGAIMTLNTYDSFTTASGEEKMAVEYSGDDIKIGFGGERLLDMLSNFSGKEISVRLKSSKQAVLIAPIDQEGIVHPYGVLMPIIVPEN